MLENLFVYEPGRPQTAVGRLVGEGAVQSAEMWHLGSGTAAARQTVARGAHNNAAFKMCCMKETKVRVSTQKGNEQDWRSKY